MNPALLLTLGCALAAPALPAQDPFAVPPAEQLEAFAPLLGNWAGEGTIVMEPGTPPMEWTSLGSVTRTHGGHVVQEDLRVDTAMGPIEMRSMYAFDAHSESLVGHGFGPMGSGPFDVFWIDGDTLITTSSGVDPMSGSPMVERVIAAFDGDSYTMKLERAVATGPWFLHVEGTFTRTEESFAAQPAEASNAAMAMAPPEMEILNGMVGDYRMTGEVTMIADSPVMEISGEESISLMFGGQVLHNHVVGKPGDYSGESYIYWDPRENTFTQFAVNSMGRVMRGRAVEVDGKLVFTSEGMDLGMSGVDRLVLTLDESGAPAHAVMHRMSGDSRPFKMFEASYEKAGSGATALTSQFKEGRCCARAVAAGKTCTHPCCVKATEEGQVCASCNG